MLLTKIKPTPQTATAPQPSGCTALCSVADDDEPYGCPLTNRGDCPTDPARVAQCPEC